MPGIAASTDQPSPDDHVSEGKAVEVERLIAPSLAAMGFELVRVMLMGGSGRLRLQIMAERPDGSMSLDDCGEVSRAVSALLEVADPLQGPYVLEVSSPGIDRPLTRLRDFERFRGHEARVELALPLEGRRRFKGRILGIEEEAVLLAGPDDEQALKLPFRNVAKAKLLLTEDLLARSRARQKHD